MKKFLIILLFLITFLKCNDDTDMPKYTPFINTNPSYTLTYDGNGNTSGSVPTDLNSPYKENSLVTVLGNTGNLSKNTSIFSNWNTVSNGSGNNYSIGSTFSITQNTILYAQYTAPSTYYTVTYNGNGNTSGSVPTDSNSPYTSGSLVTVLGNTGNLSNGNSWLSWNTIANGSGTAYSSGSTFTIVNNTTLYAIYDSGGSSGTLYGWLLTTNNIGLKGDYSALTELTNYTGIGYESDGVLYVTQSGITITNKLIPYQCNIESASNVVFDKCLIKPGGVGPGMPAISDPNGALTLQDCEIDGTDISDARIVYCIGYSGFGSVIRTNIHHVATGIKGGNKNSKQSVYENVYVHDLRWISPAHMDGITIRQSNGSGGCLIKNGRYIVASSEGVTGACFLQGQNAINNITVEGNMLEGYGYCLALEANTGGYSNVVASNNRMTPYSAGQYAYVTGGSGWDTWSENYAYNGSNPPDYKGTSISEP